MATLIYLDVEDEITSAATRIRTAREGRVALVLPFGSRVATSRINFRLLSREALANGRRLDIVAPDASARALAASAGLAVFASVGEYEAAIEAGDPAPDVDGGPEAAAAAGGAAGATGVATGGAAGAAASTAGTPRTGPATRTGAPSRDALAGADPGEDERTAVHSRAHGSPRVVRPARSFRPGGALVAGFGLLALGLLAAGVAAWLLLPEARITLTPRLEAIGPISLTIRADPDATAVDPEARVIPATTVSIPLRVQGTFPSTGTRVEQTAATGTVTFESINTVGPVAVPAGTRVATLDGVVFLTTARVVVPQAQVAGDRIERGRVDAGVRADRPGPGGNVAAGAITQVPASLQTQQVSVSNPAATSGGTRTEFPRVVQADIDGALAQLRGELEAAFAEALVDPVGVPSGARVFPETAVLGEPRTDVDPATLLDQEVATFGLQMAADGTVQAVNEAPLQTIAEDRLQGSVDDGYELVEGSSVVEIGTATIADGIITFPVRGWAQQLRPVDRDALAVQVLGLSRAEAAALLAPFGTVDIVLSPDWVSTVPTFAQRVTFTVAAPAGEPLPTPAPAPSVMPTEEPSEDAGGSEPVPSPS